MNFTQALSQVSKDKSKQENFLQIEFDYSTTLVLPYKEGIKLLEALNHSEQYTKKYSDDVPSLSAFGNKRITTKIMSKEEYQLVKVAQLMQITYKEVIDMHNSESDPQLHL